MRQRQGFTLIELLVVIAIIALLLAILMPSLQVAKRMAQGVVCLSDTRGLSLGWTLYTNDYDGRVPHSAPGTSSERWVQPPQDEDGNSVPTKTATFDDRVRGIEAGALFQYAESHKLFHCPGDRRFSAEYHNYLSYAMPDALGRWIKKITEIAQPQEKYIFVEESDTRSYMVGGWGLGTKEQGWDGWWDGLAVWHNKSSTFGFGDGHAERHKWVNEITLERANRDLTGGGGYGKTKYTSGPREDLDWLQAHWPAAR